MEYPYEEQFDMEMMNNTSMNMVGSGDAYHPQPYMGIENTRSMNIVESGGMNGIITNTHMNNVEIGGADSQEEARAGKKKQRLAEHQMQQLEAFYREVPYPDETQRFEYSKAVGLTPSQVKYWFQNKRTQMKRRIEREESLGLEIEKKKLEAENMRYRDALSSTLCPNCCGEYELKLLRENANLMNQVEYLRSFVARYMRYPQMIDPTLDDYGASSSHGRQHINN